MALHPGPAQVLIREVRSYDETEVQALRPDGRLQSATVHELGATPPDFHVDYDVGDTVFFSDQAPLIRWPDGLWSVGVMSIIAWGDPE